MEIKTYDWQKEVVTANEMVEILSYGPEFANKTEAVKYLITQIRGQAEPVECMNVVSEWWNKKYGE